MCLGCHLWLQCSVSLVDNMCCLLSTLTVKGRESICLVRASGLTLGFILLELKSSSTLSGIYCSKTQDAADEKSVEISGQSLQRRAGQVHWRMMMMMMWHKDKWTNNFKRKIKRNQVKIGNWLINQKMERLTGLWTESNEIFMIVILQYNICFSK